ncbi:hypothetical protein QF037_009286 [Streptomyces canus]|nr:hypothetical protein [Streptomyces canus]
MDELAAQPLALPGVAHPDVQYPPCTARRTGTEPQPANEVVVGIEQDDPGRRSRGGSGKAVPPHGRSHPDHLSWSLRWERRRCPRFQCRSPFWSLLLSASAAVDRWTTWATSAPASTAHHPTGPGWYATPTLAYAVKLGFEVAPLEAYVRRQSGRYLDPWYNQLRDAYGATMAELGVTTAMGGSEFLETMAHAKSIDPTLALLAKAIKATAKGGIGKLRQRNSGQVPYYEPWPALKRETWRPDIRAAVLANQRVCIHRKLMKAAAAADLYPVAIRAKTTKTVLTMLLNSSIACEVWAMDASSGPACRPVGRQSTGSSVHTGVPGKSGPLLATSHSSSPGSIAIQGGGEASTFPTRSRALVKERQRGSHSQVKPCWMSHSPRRPVLMVGLVEGGVGLEESCSVSRSGTGGSRLHQHGRRVAGIPRVEGGAAVRRRSRRRRCVPSPDGGAPPAGPAGSCTSGPRCRRPDIASAGHGADTVITRRSTVGDRLRPAAPIPFPRGRAPRCLPGSRPRVELRTGEGSTSGCCATIACRSRMRASRCIAQVQGVVATLPLCAGSR